MTIDTDNIPVAISMRSQSGHYTYVNRAWCELFSMERVDVVGRMDGELGLDPLALPHDAGAAFSELTYRDVFVTTRHKGRLLLELIESCIPGDDGGSILCVHQDLTGIGWRIEDMTNTLYESESRSRKRLQNLMEISRQLCHPLQEMEHRCEDLQKSGLTEAQSAWVEMLHTNAGLLQRQIERVLALSVSELGQPEAIEKPVRLDKLAKDISSQFRRSTGSNLLQLHVDPVFSKPIIGDEPKLRQVLISMLESVTFSGQQGIVTLSLEAPSAQAACIRLVSSQANQQGDEVPKELPHLGSSLSTQIIRGLIGLMGGRFEVDQTPGRATELRVFLRLRQ